MSRPGLLPPARHRYLRKEWDELTPEQRAIAIREVAKLKETHTLYAAWSVAINRARHQGS